MPEEHDYFAKKYPSGRKSARGRDVRKCPRKLKFRLWELAKERIAGGNDSYFIHNPNALSRWTPRTFEPIAMTLIEEMPELCEPYLTGRWIQAPSLLMERHHKMYYVYKDGKRTRAISDEHPSRWPNNWRELE